jgi:hypothetical protein
MHDKGHYYALNGGGGMSDSVTLKLTRAEALALDELVSTSAEKFFMVVGGDKDYTFEGWNKEAAAAACDKLREAALGQSSSGPWSELITTLAD